MHWGVGEKGVEGSRRGSHPKEHQAGGSVS